jgi:23S rRNA (guanosine2251-2'-O)-methyltransferase
MEAFPFRQTEQSCLYDGIRNIPVSVLLDNVRSLYNVGSFFRTCDAAGIPTLYLGGITGHPPHRGISKTALGAENNISWHHHTNAAVLVEKIRESGQEIVAVETSPNAVDLYDWQPIFPVCLVFGNEITGVSSTIAERAETHVRIPSLGIKQSLNVATAGGVVIYELLRKFRRQREHDRH